MSYFSSSLSSNKQHHTAANNSLRRTIFSDDDYQDEHYYQSSDGIDDDTEDHSEYGSEAALMGQIPMRSSPNRDSFRSHNTGGFLDMSPSMVGSSSATPKSPLMGGSGGSKRFKSLISSSSSVRLPSRIKYLNKGFFNSVLLGFSFLVLFSAFNIILFYFQEIRRRITTSSVVLYASLSLSSLIAPSILKIVGLRTSMICGALLYALFVLSLCFDLPALSYTCSTISGVGASLLWVSHAEMLTRSATYYQRIARKERNKIEIDHMNSIYSMVKSKSSKSGVSHIDDVMGLFTGTFFSIYQLNAILGNIVATGLIQSTMTDFWLFMVLFIISLFGVILLLPLRSISLHETVRSAHVMKEQALKKIRNNDSSFRNLETGRSNGDHNETVIMMKSNSSISLANDTTTHRSESEDEESNPPSAAVDDTVSICTIEFELPKPPTRRDKVISFFKNLFDSIKVSFMVLISPKMLLFSVIFLYSGYSIAFFYRSLPRIMQKHSNTFLVPWAIACFGISEVFGSLIFGRLSDKIGKRTVMILTLVLHVLAISSTFATVYWPPSYYTYFVPLFLCGLADAGLNTIIYSVIGGTDNYFKNDRTAEGFGVFKFIQSAAVCVGIISGVELSVHTVQFSLSALLLVCIIFYIVLDFCCYPFDRKPRRKEYRRGNLQESPLLPPEH